MTQSDRATPLAHERARELRRALTPPEARLWVALRRRGLGLRFRRQAPFGPYILDFYAARQRIAVEVDGIAHATDEQAAHDARRDAYLKAEGVRVLRVPAWAVRDDLEAVLAWVAAEVVAPSTADRFVVD